MTDDDNPAFVGKIEYGAMITAPVYQSHKRGKNWMATIAPDPGAPGGLARTFVRPGRGRYYYIVSADLVGSAVEFGADYYSAGGNRSPSRWYGVVLSVTDDEITIAHYPTSTSAIKAAAAVAGLALDAPPGAIPSPGGDRLVVIALDRSDEYSHLASTGLHAYSRIYVGTRELTDPEIAAVREEVAATPWGDNDDTLYSSYLDKICRVVDAHMGTLGFSRKGIDQYVDVAYTPQEV